MSDEKPLTDEELDSYRKLLPEYSRMCAEKGVEPYTGRMMATIDALKAESERREALPTIVCLCGSSRFVPEMAVIAWKLERDEGKIAVGLHLLPDNYPGVQADHQAEAEGMAEKMDALHLRKIDLADQVLVVNICGYIGESTRREIAYAREQGKDVRFLEPEGN